MRDARDRAEPADAGVGGGLRVLELRLQEARRLMLSEDLDAAEAGYRVGYEDPSHFSREYKRHFGEPPMRDLERLRELATA